MADQTYAGMSLTDIAQALHMPNLTDDTVKAVLKDHGITNKSSAQDLQSFISHQAAPDQGGGQSPLAGLVHDVSGAVGDVTQPAKQAYDESLGRLTPNVQALVEEGPEGPLESAVTAKVPGALEGIKKDVLAKQPAAAPKLPSAQEAAAAAKKKAADKTPAAATQSPYEELANALASSYLQQVNQLEPLISGQGIYGTGGETDQAVQAASAMAPGAGGWLGQQAAAEKTASAPLQAAMGQVGNAEAAGAIPAAGAIANTGLANTEYLQSAPYQQILSELANETAYRAASSGASAFGNSPLASSPLLQSIFTQLGLGGSTTPGSPTLPGAKTGAKGGTSGTASTTGSAQGNNPTG